MEQGNSNVRCWGTLMVFLATMSAIYRNRLEHSGPRPCIYWNITWFLRMRCNRYVALAEWSLCCGISVIMYIPIHTVMCMELLCDAFYVIVGSCITCLYFTVAYWFLLIILAWEHTKPIYYCSSTYCAPIYWVELSFQGLVSYFLAYCHTRE